MFLSIRFTFFSLRHELISNHKSEVPEHYVICIFPFLQNLFNFLNFHLIFSWPAWSWWSDCQYNICFYQRISKQVSTFAIRVTNKGHLTYVNTVFLFQLEKSFIGGILTALEIFSCIYMYEFLLILFQTSTLSSKSSKGHSGSAMLPHPVWIKTRYSLEKHLFSFLACQE